MYENFKSMIELAEKIGTIEAADLHINSKYYGTRAEVAGAGADGVKFHLEVWVDKEPANE